MRRGLLGFLLLVSLLIGQSMAASGDGVKIALIGDSTVCDYAVTDVKRGWGQMMRDRITSNTIVINAAAGGLSSQSFPRDRWRSVLEQKPDFVLIQFGHNDAKQKDPARYTDPDTTYRENLRRFAMEARAAGATPIFVTPVRRRIFKDGLLSTELRRYADAMKAEGAASNVAVIDLHELSGRLYTELGEDRSATFTVNQLDNEDRPGAGDRSHFTEYGATKMVGLVVEELSKLDPKLAGCILAMPSPSGQ